MPKEPSLPTWGIHAMVDETTELLCAFVAHHIQMGASEIHLSFDRDNPEAFRILGKLPQCRLILCDEAYWAATRFGTRPTGLNQRQSYNATRAYQESQADWMINCDADEYLCSDLLIAEVLNQVPPVADFVRIANFERVFVAGEARRTIFDGVFRLQKKRAKEKKRSEEIWNAVYGADSEFFTRGLIGHVAGKSICRTGRNLTITPHFPTRDGPPRDRRTKGGRRSGVARVRDAARWWKSEMFQSPRARRRRAKRDLAVVLSPSGPKDIGQFGAPIPFVTSDLSLAHFDGITPLHWTMKHARYYAFSQEGENAGKEPEWKGRQKGRVRQIKAVQASLGDPAALADMTNRLLFLRPDQFQALSRYDALTKPRLDPVAAVHAVFPDEPLNYDPDHYDQALRERFSDLFEKFGI